MMFSVTTSPSRTYVAIYKNHGGGYSFEKFTIPSDTTFMVNTSSDAEWYFRNVLYRHRWFAKIEGAVTYEDYANLIDRKDDTQNSEKGETSNG